MVETTHDALLRQTAAAEELLTYFQGNRAAIDADVAAAQAGYAALANNLKGVVTAQMSFTGVIDPDTVAPTNIDGGTFQSIAAFVNAAPAGSHRIASLAAGKTHYVSADLNIYSGALTFEKSGAGANPVIMPRVVIRENLNIFCNIVSRGVVAFYFSEVDVSFLDPKLDDGLPWQTAMGFIRSGGTGFVAAGYFGGVISAPVAGGPAVGLVIGSSARTVSLGLQNCTLDGVVFAVKAASAGIVTIASAGVTLQNGAVLRDGGTIGTNVLEG